jgi:hypothetical protein
MGARRALEPRQGDRAGARPQRGGELLERLGDLGRAALVKRSRRARNRGSHRRGAPQGARESARKTREGRIRKGVCGLGGDHFKVIDFSLGPAGFSRLRRRSRVPLGPGGGRGSSPLAGKSFAGWQRPGLRTSGPGPRARPDWSPANQGLTRSPGSEAPGNPLGSGSAGLGDSGMLSPWKSRASEARLYPALADGVAADGAAADGAAADGAAADGVAADGVAADGAAAGGAAAGGAP